MFDGAYTHLDHMLTSKYQSIDWTQHTNSKRTGKGLLMRPNEGRNSCPGHGWSRVKFSHT